MTLLPNYDYDAENADLQRKQKLAEAMMQSGLSPMDSNLGWGVKQSPLAAVAKVLQAYLGGKMGEANKTAQGDLANRYKADAKSGLSDFINGISATAGTTDPGVQVEGTAATGQQGAPQGNNPSAFVPPSMVTPEDAKRKHMEAIANAMASNNPILQQLGMSTAGQMFKAKEGLTAKDFLGHADAPTIEALAKQNGLPGFGAKRTITMGKPGEIPVDTSTGAPVQPAQAGGVTGHGPAVPEGWKLVGEQNGIQILQDPKGSLYQRSAYGLDQVDKAPKTTISTHTTVNSGENAFAKGVGELNAKELGDMRKAGDAARKMAPVLNQLEQLTQQPTFSGPQANASVWLGELASSVGMKVDKAKLANSEEYAGVLAKQISSYLTAGAGVGRSLTNPDREALERQFPALIRTPDGRMQIIRTLREANARDVAQADAAEAEVGRRYPELKRLVPGGLASSPASATPQSAGMPGATPSVSNWPGGR